MDENDMHGCKSNNYRVWLLDSRSTRLDELICDNFVQEKRHMANKKGKVLTSKGIGNVIVSTSL